MTDEEDDPVRADSREERDDPVRAAFRDEEDLYDVATWDVRTWVDRFAVRLTERLRQSRRAILFAFALVLLLAQGTSIGLLIYSRPVLGVLGVLSVLPAFGLAAYLWLGDPTRQEPLDLLAITFVLGVLFATLAAVVNTVAFSLVGSVATVPAVALYGPAVLFFVVVGPIEETVKVLAVRAYAYRRPRFETVVDGVVYGAVAGLGFATFENFVYIAEGYLVTAASTVGKPVGDAVSTATSRAFVGPGHVIYSSFAGYYLGLAKFNPASRGPIIVKGLVIAAFLHAVHNTVVTYVQFEGLTVLLFIVFFDAFLLGILLRKVRRYRGYYRQIPAQSDASPAGSDPSMAAGTPQSEERDVRTDR